MTADTAGLATTAAGRALEGFVFVLALVVVSYPPLCPRFRLSIQRAFAVPHVGSFLFFCNVRRLSFSCLDIYFLRILSRSCES